MTKKRGGIPAWCRMFKGTKYENPYWYLEEPGYCQETADRAVKFWTNYLVHIKGRWEGQPFIPLDWQEHRVIRPLFGVLNPATGFRQYRRAYIEIPKKNGKSELGAGVALKLLNADREPSAEVYSAATSKEQASLVFNVAEQMTRLEPRLLARAKIRPSTKRIMVPSWNSLYRVLSADVPTKHGLNVHGCIFDELHAQPHDLLWKVLTKGSSVARDQPLIFSITTAGNKKTTVCGLEHDYCLKIQRGEIDNPTILPVIYYLENNEDWEDEENWYKVNPSMGPLDEGYIFDIDRMREDYQEAKDKPSDIPEFRQLRLNQWISAQARWIRQDRWAECGKHPVVLEELKGRPCFGALDLSSNTDLAVFMLVFPWEEKEGQPCVKVIGRYWIPEETIEERTKIDGVPYRYWAGEGMVKSCPGIKISQRQIQQQVERDGEQYKILEIMYDRWSADYIVENLEQEGFTMVPIGQGFASMNAPSKFFEVLYLDGALHHGNDPVINWAAENVVIETDAAECIKPTKHKEKSPERIDPIVGIIMALDGYRRRVEKKKKSVYETRGIVSVSQPSGREQDQEEGTRDGRQPDEGNQDTPEN